MMLQNSSNSIVHLHTQCVNMKTKPVCTRCSSDKLDFSFEGAWNGYKFEIKYVELCYCHDCGDEVGWDMISDPD